MTTALRRGTIPTFTRRALRSLGWGFLITLTCPATGEIVPPNESAIAGVRAGSVETARASWWGFDSTDATRALQSALDSPARKIVVDKMVSPWIVTPIRLPSDKEIVFESGVVVEAKRGAFLGKGDCLFTAKGRRNLVLRGTGATFRMHKTAYQKAPYDPAEWRHTLSLCGCESITVEGLTLAESGGDGIYLGAGSNAATNRDITIRKVVCDDNNRQGISVITAENLLIEDCIFRNTRGTAPQAGIDFEPNHPTEPLVNCVLRNCRSENNGGHAYHFYLGNMHRDSPPVSIRLENCSSTGNARYSTYLGIANRDGRRSVRGSIVCIGSRFDADPGGGIYIRGNEAEGCRITLRDCEIIRRDAADAPLAPITIEAPRQMDLDAGNIKLDNCLVRDAVDRRPLDLIASPLTRIQNLTGQIRYESPEGTETFQINASQLSAWFPDHRKADRIPRHAFDWSRAIPASPDPPAARVLPKLRLRSSATLMVWGEAKVPCELLVAIEPVGRHDPASGVMTLSTPTGVTKPLRPKRRDKLLAYTFTPTATGPVRLRWEGSSRETIRPVRCSARIAISSEAHGLHLFRSTGTLHFGFPAGRKQGALLVTGAGTAETVKAIIRNSDGETIDQQDNIALPHVFVLNRDAANSHETWSITLERASEGVLEDVTIQTLGIPPLLAPSSGDLLTSP